MFKVVCLDNGNNYYYQAKSPYEAMTKMKYVLDLSNKDSACIINKTESGKHLFMDHSGKTYAVRI